MTKIEGDSWPRWGRRGELGIPKDSAAGRREFEKIMEARRLLDDAPGVKRLRRSLSQLRKGDAGKVQIARRLRVETTVTLQPA